jgi:hypothetical protein
MQGHVLVDKLPDKDGPGQDQRDGVKKDNGERSQDQTIEKPGQNAEKEQEIHRQRDVGGPFGSIDIIDLGEEGNRRQCSRNKPDHISM